jgi:hypothetical protein
MPLPAVALSHAFAWLSLAAHRLRASHDASPQPVAFTTHTHDAHLSSFDVSVWAFERLADPKV